MRTLGLVPSSDNHNRISSKAHQLTNNPLYKSKIVFSYTLLFLESDIVLSKMHPFGVGAISPICHGEKGKGINVV